MEARVGTSLTALIAAIALNPVARAAEPAPPLVIRDVTIISPERAAPLQHAHVRIRDGLIAEISDKPLEEKQQIDGRGRFLIPGLIDSHVHIRTIPGMVDPQRAAHSDIAAMADAQEPRSYLYFGYTTVLSLGDTAPNIKKWNELDTRPDAYFCGGTPMVNGYSYRGPAQTPYFIYNPDQLSSLPAGVDPKGQTPEAVVAAMARDGAVCVKSYRESGFGSLTGKLPVPSVELIQRVVKAAHARNMPVFLHANSREAHAFAVQAGVDALAHGMWNGHLSTPEKLSDGVEPILKDTLARRMGYQPTSQVIRGLAEMLNNAFLDDPLLTQVYPAKLLAWYRSPEGAWFRKEELGDVEARVFNRGTRAGDSAVGYLARNNARLLFGTDTPSAPVYTNPPGLNGFYEMRRWVAAGVSLKQILHAATLENARIMRLDRQIGTVEKGKRAHLVLLRANPLESVEAYNTVDTVFLAGRPIKREDLSAKNAPAK